MGRPLIKGLRFKSPPAGRYVQGWVKLQEWFRPQLAFAQLSLNDLQDCGIGDVEEAANVGRIVFNDSGMGLKNIHIRYASSSVWCGSWGTVRQAIDPGKPLTLKGRLARILLIDWCCMAIDPLSC